MSEPLDPEVEEALAALRATYVQALGGKLAEVVEAAAKARASGERAALREAHRVAHRLFGSAGAYGLEDVATPLGAIEARLYAALEGEEPADAAMWADVERALEAACAAGVLHGAGERTP